MTAPNALDAGPFNNVTSPNMRANVGKVSVWFFSYDRLDTQKYRVRYDREGVQRGREFHRNCLLIILQQTLKSWKTVDVVISKLNISKQVNPMWRPIGLLIQYTLYIWYTKSMNRIGWSVCITQWTVIGRICPSILVILFGTELINKRFLKNHIVLGWKNLLRVYYEKWCVLNR